MRSPITEKYLPKNLSPEDYDDYLSKGWYRLGAKIFTTQYLFMDHNLFSPVWIRLPLKGYGFRKSLRKILKRNKSQFKTVCRPQVLDLEKEMLYQTYRKSFKGRLSLSLIAYLQDAAEETVFNTMEFCVYDGDRLVACSFFDLGKKTVSSIVGIYDPEYSKHSLGLYTMLLEVEFGLENGYDYFYPGYIVPGNKRFDYKLRIGTKEDIEYWDIRGEDWKRMTSYNENATQTYETGFELGRLRRLLKTEDIQSDILFYPSFEPELANNYSAIYNDSPLFLSCFSGFFLQPQFIIFYDFFTRSFRFYFCKKSPEEEHLDNPDNASEFYDFFNNRQLIIETTDVLAVVQAVKDLHYQAFQASIDDLSEG